MDKPRLKVSLRGGFSDRNGIKPENTVLQYEELDQRTRTALFNAFNRLFNELFTSMDSYRFKNDFILAVFTEVYGQQVDYSKQPSQSFCMETIKETIMLDDYDSVLTLIEFLFLGMKAIDKYNEHRIVDQLNAVLEREYVGYRFVNSLITPITNEQELETLNEALQSSHKKVSNHLDKAVCLFSDRNNPDYENSIKESITAVEAMCEIIAGEQATLSSCLLKIKKSGIVIHPALEEGFKKLYAYTSDASGIRHAGSLTGKSATFAEAKYMLVSCSAFINYLKEVAP